MDRRDPPAACRTAPAHRLIPAGGGSNLPPNQRLAGWVLFSRISRDFGMARLWPWIEKSPARRFSFAAIVAVSASLLHWLIFPLTHGRTSFIFFPPAIILVTTIAGRWPGILVASIGVLNSALQKDQQSLFVFEFGRSGGGHRLRAGGGHAHLGGRLLPLDLAPRTARPARAPRAQRDAGFDPRLARSAAADHAHLCAHAWRGQGAHLHPRSAGRSAHGRRQFRLRSRGT